MEQKAPSNHKKGRGVNIYRQISDSEKKDLAKNTVCLLSLDH